MRVYAVAAGHLDRPQFELVIGYVQESRQCTIIRPRCFRPKSSITSFCGVTRHRRTSQISKQRIL